MKKFGLAFILLTALAIFILLLRSRMVQQEAQVSSVNEKSNAAERSAPRKEEREKPEFSGRVPTRAERMKMPSEARLRLYEALGKLPEDADPREFALAQKTTWWGRDIDPKTFWRRRVVWWDRAAEDEAHRRGRMYPPPPYPLTNSVKRETTKHQYNTGGPESSGGMYVYTPEEDAFWDEFTKTHPRPPEKLQQEQLLVANNVLRQPAQASNNIGGPPLPDASSEGILKIYITRAMEQGLPEEAFSWNALFGAYVTAKRDEYSRLINSGRSSDSPAFRSFFRGLKVDPKFITGSLDDEELQSANIWKIAYLQRLRREKVDESYIQAYLKAWNLSEKQVFSSPTN